MTFVYFVALSLPMVFYDGTRNYVWGVGLAYVVNTGNGNAEVYHTDDLGTVQAITNATGSIIQTYQTDEFGVLT